MTKRRITSPSNEGIQADTINAKAVAAGPNAKAIVNEQNSTSADQIANAFAILYEKVQNMPDGPEKEIAEKSVNALELEAQKGEQAKEESIEKWINFLAQTAPSAFEVAIATFINPMQGLSLAFRKIAEQAKANREKGQRAN